MLLIPLATFYFSYIILFKQNPDMLGWSGLLAVIATNCVIAAYVIMAWNEEDGDDKTSDSKVNKKSNFKKGPTTSAESVLKVD